MLNEYRNTLLINVKELKNTSLFSNNIDDNILNSVVNTVQEVYLEGITGTALFHRLQQLVYNEIKGEPDAINDNENLNYRELLEEFVKPYLKSRAIVDILYPLAYKVRNAGIVKTNDTNIVNADLNDIKYLEKQYGVYVAEYEERLSKYLCENKENFPELEATTPSFFDEPSLGKDYASESGLWLGRKNKNKCGTCR